MDSTRRPVLAETGHSLDQSKPLMQTAPPSRIMLGGAVLNPDSAIPRQLSVCGGATRFNGQRRLRRPCSSGTQVTIQGVGPQVPPTLSQDGNSWIVFLGGTEHRTPHASRFGSVSCSWGSAYRSFTRLAAGRE